MKDLVEALAIFARYTDASRPTHCEHDVLYVLVDPAKVSTEDRTRLDELGFRAGDRYAHFYSFRFGAA